MSNKKEIRVFLSSTFRDLDEERAYLSKHTFPLLRTYCNRKGVHFSEIDLRWGLTEEDSKNGRIMRLCLDQIQDCKPFFIGILGSRYGWIPTLSDLQKDRQLKDNYPEVVASVAESRSVVEIEFEHGMLNEPQPEYQFVYAKQQEKRNPRVEELIGRVREKQLMLTEFSSLEELHGAVLNDLQRAVDQYLAKAKSIWADEDQLAFMTERLRSYIEHPSYSSKLDEQLAQERSMTIVTGDSGSGKSALLAHTIERLRQDANRIVLGHFVGASPASRNSRGIFDHLAEQLKRNYEIDLGSTSTFSSLQDEFAFLLSKINDRGAVIVIDALDQLDDDSQPLDWLPEYLPERVHLIVSTTPGSILKRLRQRSWDEFAMEPFDREEREAFVVRYLSDYGKSLASDHVSSIAANPKCRNPLFLKMLLEEVRLSAHFVNLDETIDHYLSVKDLDGLFQLMLERMEEQLGQDLVEAVFASLAISPTGLRATELANLARLNEQTIQQFIQTHAHLVLRVADRYSIFHKALEQAIAVRYLNDEDHRLERARAIIDTIRTIGDKQRIADEAVWLSLEYKLHPLLVDLLAIPEVFRFVTDEWDISRPTQLGSKILKGTDVVGLSNTLVDLWQYSVDESTQTKLYIDLSKILITAGHFEQSLDVLRRVKIGRLETVETMVEYHNLQGTAYQELGQNDSALRQFENAHELTKQPGFSNSELRLEVTQNAGITAYYLGDLTGAQNQFTIALKICEEDPRLSQEKIETLSGIGATYYQSRDFIQAELYFSKALQLARSLFPPSDARLFGPLNNLGTVEVFLGRLSSAGSHLTESFQLALEVYGPGHLRLMEAFTNLGRLREAEGRLELATQLYSDALKLARRFLNQDHSTVQQIESLLDRVANMRTVDLTSQ